MLKERELIVKYGQKMLDEKLTKGSGGNLSIFNRELNLMAISPSGKDYYETKLEDIVIMDLDGKIIEGDKPSSEWQMHLIYYQKRQDVNAVFHTHSKYATTLSCLRKDLLPVHYLIAVAGYEVLCADYAVYGSYQLAENAFLKTEDRNAVLLANHGLITVASSIEDAFSYAVHLEYVAEIYCNILMMQQQPVCLNKQQLDEVMQKFKTYRYR